MAKSDGSTGLAFLVRVCGNCLCAVLLIGIVLPSRVVAAHDSLADLSVHAHLLLLRGDVGEVRRSRPVVLWVAGLAALVVQQALVLLLVVVVLLPVDGLEVVPLLLGFERLLLVRPYRLEVLVVRVVHFDEQEGLVAHLVESD